MARRGRFGRTRRSAPSLTTAIVSIAAAFQAQRDQNITDAWKNGGQFEGAPVTDDRMLAYWQGRLKGVSPKDPNYDQYSNVVLQFEYAIAQSKNELAYAKGEISDLERAQFFLDWSKKVPQDSELYRTLQKNAAQFIQRAKAAASSAASAAQSQASAAADQATFDEYGMAGDLMTRMLLQFAKDKQYIGTDEDLGNLVFSRGGGPGGMIDLINQMNAERPGWIEQLRAADPSLTGPVTYEWYQKALLRQKEGLTIIRNRAVAAGRKTTDIDKEISALDETAQSSAMWDTAQSYNEARKTWLLTWGDPTSTPTDKLKAWDVYRKALVKMGSDPANPVDPAIQTTLFAEAGYDPATNTFDVPDTTVDTWWENATRAKSVAASQSKGEPSGDNADTATWLVAFANEAAAVKTGQYVWTYGKRDAKGNFTPSNGGSDVGIVDIGTATSSGAQPVAVQQADGSILMVYAPPTPVTLTVLDANGNQVEGALNPDGSKSDGTVGNVFTVYQGGKATIVYSFVDNNGITRYSTESPWKGVLTTDAKGKPTVVVQETTTADGKSNIAWVTTPDKTTGEPKTIGYNPTQTAKDSIRDIAGINHQADSLSAFLASIQAMDSEERQRVAQDPNLRAQVVAQFWNTIASEPDQAKRAEAFRQFLAQLDGLTQPNLAGQGGLASPYDNRTNAPAFQSDVTITDTVGVKVATGVNNANEPGTSTVNGSVFFPLAQTMIVPGRFGRPDSADTQSTDTGVKIIAPRIKVPSAEPVPAGRTLLPPGAVQPPYVPPVEPVVGPAPGAYVPPPTPVGPAPGAYIPPPLASPGSTTYVPGGRMGF